MKYEHDSLSLSVYMCICLYACVHVFVCVRVCIGRNVKRDMSVVGTDTADSKTSKIVQSSIYSDITAIIRDSVFQHT